VEGAFLSREVLAIWAVTLSTGADMFAEVWVVDEHEVKIERVEKLKKLGVLVEPVKVTLNSSGLLSG
jgi:hypothetical protein